MRLVLLGTFVLGFGCSSSSGGGDADADVDGDTDADVDSDTDVDPCDVDGDGHPSIDCAGDDCDDSNRDVHPGAPDEEVEIETVDSAARTGWFSSLAIDSAGTAWVAYYDLVGSAARVATRSEGLWSQQTLEAGTLTNLAIGPDDVVHVVFGTEEPIGVRHASNDGGAFAIETVADGGSPARNGSGVVIDADGGAHVVYTSCPGYGGCTLSHATDASGAWTSEPVVQWGSASSPSIALGPSGDLHVAYLNNNALGYVTNVSGSWADPIGIGGTTFGVGIAVAADGTVHVVGYDVASRALRHWSSANGWASEDVYPDLAGGGDADVAVDANGAVHACFALDPQNDPTAALLYATNARGAWEVVRVDEVATGYYCSIALAGGGVHISWFDGGAGVLKYARFGIPDDEDGDCDGEVEGPPWRPTSGLAPSGTLGDLGADDWQTFCEWSIDLQGGESTVHPCPDGEVTVSTVAECVDQSSAFAGCSVTVATAETCVRAMSEDPCEGYLDPACAQMFSCAM